MSVEVVALFCRVIVHDEHHPDPRMLEHGQDNLTGLSRPEQDQGIHSRSDYFLNALLDGLFETAVDLHHLGQIEFHQLPPGMFSFFSQVVAKALAIDAGQAKEPVFV